MVAIPESAWVVLLGLGVGALHMLAPDHWVPLTVYCHQKEMGVRRTALIAAAGGAAHVAGSLLAMFLALAIGLAVAYNFSQFSAIAVGLSFLAIGVWKLASTLRSRSRKDDPESRDVRGTKWLVFAATTSPELTIFPIFLAASVYGLWVVLVCLLMFALGTVASLVSITVAGVRGMGRFLRGSKREMQIDYAISAILLALGIVVLAGA